LGCIITHAFCRCNREIGKVDGGLPVTEGAIDNRKALPVNGERSPKTGRPCWHRGEKATATGLSVTGSRFRGPAISAFAAVRISYSSRRRFRQAGKKAFFEWTPARLVVDVGWAEGYSCSNYASLSSLKVGEQNGVET
jgi:hypothetical protein